jgi:hypothetical protein
MKLIGLISPNLTEDTLMDVYKILPEGIRTLDQRVSLFFTGCCYIGFHVSILQKCRRVLSPRPFF